MTEDELWESLLALVDRHYPEHVFPTRPDTPHREIGPRIVSLIRQINQIRRMA